MNQPIKKFRIYRFGDYPKPKKHFFKEEFVKRQQARNFCYHRSWEDGLTIVHPDGTEEPFKSQ